MMADLHAYLSIYGWVGNLKCRTALAWQSVYGGWSVDRPGGIRESGPRRRRGAPRRRRLESVEAVRGDAAAPRGDDASSPWKRFAATARLPRGSSADGSRRRRGEVVDRCR